MEAEEFGHLLMSDNQVYVAFERAAHRIFTMLGLQVSSLPGIGATNTTDADGVLDMDAHTLQRVQRDPNFVGVFEEELKWIISKNILNSAQALGAADVVGVDEDGIRRWACT